MKKINKMKIKLIKNYRYKIQIKVELKVIKITYM